MAHHAAIIIDHAIAFDSIEEFAERLSNITGLPYFIQEVDADGSCVDAPFEFEGWLVSYYAERKNMDDGGLIDFALVSASSEDVSTFYLSKDCLEVNNMFPFGDWDKTIEFIKEIIAGEKSEWMNARLELYRFFKPLGTKRMLFFCGSEHEYWLDEIGSKSFTFDVARNYANKYLKIVNLADIPQLPSDFFDQEGNYENFCIYDTFEDLKD
ncbi:MAG: hypothetical protein V4613_00620 [Bacteroidota bacterium]